MGVPAARSRCATDVAESHHQIVEGLRAPGTQGGSPERRGFKPRCFSRWAVVADLICERRWRKTFAVKIVLVWPLERPGAWRSSIGRPAAVELTLQPATRSRRSTQKPSLFPRAKAMP
jgi:hypothetical protein